MPIAKTLLLLFAILISPSVAMAQAAVSSDQPLSRSNDGAPASQGSGLDAQRSRDVPNPLTGPGSPGTTGTGAAGTGPTGTMAAPGR